MGTRLHSQISSVMIAAFVVVIVALIFVADRIGNVGRENASTVTESSYSPAIPESSATAKEYIDAASKAAEIKDYAAAIAILEEGLAHFPDDTNLKLTKEFYENEAARHAR